jgi:RND family efflux transporter MFP subunit
MDQNLEKLRIDRTPGAGPGRSRRLGKWWWLGGLAVLSLLGWWLAPHTRAVDTAVAGLYYPTRSLTLVNATGYVVADRKAAVAAKITSQLIWLGVEEGSIVKKDQVMARLEDQDVKAALAKAEADLKAAQDLIEVNKAELDDATLNRDRMRKLVVQGLVARADYDSAVARWRKAVGNYQNALKEVQSFQGALDLARANLDYTIIRAPFDAVVLTKNADTGDIVTPIGASSTSKASVVTIADLGSLQVEADVSESNLAKVASGQPCEIQLDAFGEERFPGYVHMIVPTADKTKATVLVKVRFDKLDPRILPQMSAKVAFLERAPTVKEREPRLAVPTKALAQAGRAVFVVVDGRARLTPIEAGQAYGDMVEITQGLKAGDRIILNPDGLKDNDSVSQAEK